jgi:hypothetical protein
MLALPADSSCCTPRRCPGNPRDGHTLATVVRATEGLTGRAIERGYVDKKYRGYYMPNPQRIFISDRSVPSSVSSNANCAAADSETRAAYVVASLRRWLKAFPASSVPARRQMLRSIGKPKPKKLRSDVASGKKRIGPGCLNRGPTARGFRLKITRGWAGSGSSLPLRPVES